jgi:hypothetical protein
MRSGLLCNFVHLVGKYRQTCSLNPLYGPTVSQSVVLRHEKKNMLKSISKGLLDSSYLCVSVFMQNKQPCSHSGYYRLRVKLLCTWARTMLHCAGSEEFSFTKHCTWHVWPVTWPWGSLPTLTVTVTNVRSLLLPLQSTSYFRQVHGKFSLILYKKQQL